MLMPLPRPILRLSLLPPLPEPLLDDGLYTGVVVDGDVRETLMTTTLDRHDAGIGPLMLVRDTSTPVRLASELQAAGRVPENPLPLTSL
jgi:hypothetical protein